MTAQNKKRKAKNSYIYGGAEKQHGIKLKRIYYYCKQDRLKAKREARKESEDAE